MEQTQSSTPTPAKRGRPEKLDKSKCEALVALHTETGRTFKALAAERHISYPSLVAALKRHGLSPRASKKVEVAAA
jgi:transposase